ncbi:hypothetical protein ACFLZ7_01715 [Nanoarchaeota archaeon]
MSQEIQYENENKANLGSKVFIAGLALATPALLSAGEAEVKNILKGSTDIKIYQAGDTGFEHYVNKKNTFDLSTIDQAKASILAAYTDNDGKRWATVYDAKDKNISNRIPMWSKVEKAAWKSMGENISPEELEKAQDHYLRQFNRDESKITDAFDSWEKNIKGKTTVAYQGKPLSAVPELRYASLDPNKSNRALNHRFVRESGIAGKKFYKYEQIDSTTIDGTVCGGCELTGPGLITFISPETGQVEFYAGKDGKIKKLKSPTDDSRAISEAFINADRGNKYFDLEGSFTLVPLNRAASDSQTSPTKYGSKFSLDNMLRVQVKVPKVGGELDVVLEHERQRYKNPEFAEELTNTDKRMRIGYLKDVKGINLGAGLTMPGQKFVADTTDDTPNHIVNPIAVELNSKGKGGYALLEVGDSYFLLEASESDVNQKTTNLAVPIPSEQTTETNGRASETRIAMGSQYNGLGRVHPSLAKYSLVGAIEISNKRGMIHNRTIDLKYGVKANVIEGLNAYVMLKNGMESGKDVIGSSTVGMKIGAEYKFGK